MDNIYPLDVNGTIRYFKNTTSGCVFVEWQQTELDLQFPSIFDDLEKLEQLESGRSTNYDRRPEMALQDVWDKGYWDGKVGAVVPTQPQDEGLGFLDVNELLEYAQNFLGDYARDVVAEFITEVMEGMRVTAQSIVDETMLTPENVILVIGNMMMMVD